MAGYPVSAWVAIAIGFCLWSPDVAAGAELIRVEKAEEAMGTTFSMVLYGDDRARLEGATSAAFAEVHRLDQMLSNYLPDSAWSEVNRSAALRPVTVPMELFQLLSDCLDYSRTSGGTFDITVGPLMKAWGFYRGEGLLPQKAEIAQALRAVGYRHVHLDRSTQSVRFDLAGVELDPGGVGKGYAVDRVIDVLKREGVKIALISAGGSSIYGMGAPPEDPQGWRITIRAPHDPHRGAAELFLRDMSFSTSGSYEKFFWANGRRYAHIMDPRTGYPARGASSVSVLAPRTIDSEVWAKPYFIQGQAWTTTHKPRDFRAFFCEDTTQAVCSWIP